MATLGNPKNTIEVLQKYNFNFQKKFGQNFLINTGILEDIIEAAEITKDDFVLEIGPGIGTMTQYLCESAREVIAVEIDKNLIPILEDTLSAYDNVEVLNDDIEAYINFEDENRIALYYYYGDSVPSSNNEQIVEFKFKVKTQEKRQIWQHWEIQRTP